MKTCTAFLILLSFIACNHNKKPKTEQQYDQQAVRTESNGATEATSSLNTTDLENFGPLKLAQRDGEVLQLFGQPAARSKAETWEADGMIHENWDYKEKGIVINMSAEVIGTNSTRKIFSITAKAPCTLKTTRNIGIGSSRQQVLDAYKGFIDESTSDEAMITVGTVYGGILFSIKDDKVETIFFGAAAD